MPRKSNKVEEQPQSIDEVLGSIIVGAANKFGEEKIYTGEESEVRLVGIMLPAVSIRYLLQSNVLPLSRVMQVNGIQESCKSAFLYELYRWCRCNGGKAYHIENESKDSHLLRMSILNYDKAAVDLMVSESLEDWQKYLSFLLGKEGLPKYLGSGKFAKSVPIFMGVDSLTAKANTESQDQIEKRGYADRSHPIDALKISSYLKYVPQKLVGWPFFLATVNHLKPSKTETGSIDYKAPGGYSMRFQETYELRLAKVKDITGVRESGVKIKIVTHKNSLGPGRLKLQVDFKWYIDPETNRQHSYWDWHTATVDLLNSFTGSQKKALDEVCHFVVKPGGDKGRLVSSKQLGITPGNPVTIREGGLLLEQKPEIVSELHKLLGIAEYSVFKPGVNYDTQMADAVTGIELAQGYAPSQMAEPNFEHSEAVVGNDEIVDPDLDDLEGL